MLQVSLQEFERLPLRVHTFLAGVPLHDVGSVDLPRWHEGVTLDDFLRTASSCLCTPLWLVRMLLDFRFFVGRSWVGITSQRQLRGRPSQLVLPRPIVRALAAAGTQHGFFRVVYRFENEQLVELINRTAHAAALSALIETATAYRFYLGVYVFNVSRLTPFYMRVVEPFRKLIVYPSLLRSVRARWNQAFGTG